MQLYRLLLLGLSFCLLSLQLSGLHLHVDAYGADNATELHGTHLHEDESDEHGHDSDVDVGLTEPGITWKNYFPILAMFTLTLLVTFPRVAKIWTPTVEPFFTSYRSHWRPPMRAPPLITT
jgi:hypothetical protein